MGKQGYEQLSLFMGTSGFTTLTPGNLSWDNNNTTNLDVKLQSSTYIVDMNAYTGGTGTFKLIDYATDSTRDGWIGAAWTTTTNSMTSDLFANNANISVINSGSLSGDIVWNNDDKSIDLVVIPEPSSLALIGLAAAASLALIRRCK